jgi:small conductance mechanosensitive channel
MLEAVLGTQVNWAVMVTALAGAVVIAYLLASVAARMAGAIFVGITGGDVTRFQSPAVRRPMRITRAAVFVAALCALIPPAFELAGAPMAIGLALPALTGWLLGSGLRVVIIVLLAYLLVRVVASASVRLEDEISHDTSAFDAAERVKRARTLSRLIRNGLTVAVVTIALLMVLRELNVDIMPVLTGAGIVGLAVGFGAQTLVKDLISGFFLILENQVRVGDVATINGTGGLVEAINLRTILLRDVEGVVHVFPNGSIQTLANRTKDFSYAVLDVPASLKEDADAVMAVLLDVGKELKADTRFGVNVLEPLEVLGVDAFDEARIVIKIRVKTVPLKQWEIGRELRRRIKKAFEARGIEVPSQRVSIFFDGTSQPFLFRQAS